MRLVSGEPFWPVKDRAEEEYPALDRDLDTEIAVIGGGITSALICLAFYQAGKQVALISDQRLGGGSTSASTALLQYEIDVDLYELKAQIGERNAIEAYRLCGEAIDGIAQIDKQFPSDFAYRPSIFMAAEEGDVKTLRQEFDAREDAGFDVQWLDKRALADAYGLRAEAAICSKLGGEIDPYKLTRQIFAYLREQGVGIYERTEIVFSEKDGQKLQTRAGRRIRARRAIFASGYKSQLYLKEKVVKLHSTYAFVTDPLPEEKLWLQKALWWDSADPYVYARTTADNRAMIGGGDRFFHRAWLRRAFHRRQIAQVLEKAERYYPAIEWKAAHSWNGVFGETKDGLAYIGAPKEWENADFALGFGGNGITYSQLAAKGLVRKYNGDEPKSLSLFRFSR